jgi:rhodanese-related sulfurtransferase
MDGRWDSSYSLNHWPLIFTPRKEKTMSSAVSRPAAANSQSALQHFQSLLEFETDCWDVHHAISNNQKDFVLLDVRCAQAYDQGHVASSIHLPYTQINEQIMQQYPRDTLFVVYCAGPHCNAADKAAVKLAKLDRPVKKMIGGVTGWLDEGFSLENAC